MPDRYYVGIEQRPRPDHNGWSLFEVFSRDGRFFWSALADDEETHMGPEHGPFPQAHEAYVSALKNGD